MLPGWESSQASDRNKCVTSFEPRPQRIITNKVLRHKSSASKFTKLMKKSITTCMKTISMEIVKHRPAKITDVENIRTEYEVSLCKKYLNK